MKSIRVNLFAISFIILSGCAAPSFVKPSPDKLILGKSTSEDVIQSLGNAPPLSGDATVNGEKIHMLTYNYGESPKFWGLVIKRRTQTYTLFDGVLVGDEYNSTFDEDATDFDTDKVELIRKGKTTRSEVTALLGKQSGNVLYPLVADKQDHGLVYAYTYARFAGILTSAKSKVLVVTLNGDGVVSNVSLKLNGVEQIKQ
jgi:hypothetical protein